MTDLRAAKRRRTSRPRYGWNYICGEDLTTYPDTTSACVSRDRHTPEPRGYGAWDTWAMKMSGTHKQRRCPDCGLWKVWVPK